MTNQARAQLSDDLQRIRSKFGDEFADRMNAALDAAEQRGAARGSVPHPSELVLTSLRDPDMVAHLPRRDCQHEMPHLLAACGAFLTEGEAREKWQPIKTMPITGQVMVWWSSDIKGESCCDILDWRGYLNCLNYGEPPATHWMPLPPAPKGVVAQKLRPSNEDRDE